MRAISERTRFAPAEVEPRIVRRRLRSRLVHPEAADTASEVAKAPATVVEAGRDKLVRLRAGLGAPPG